MREARGFKSSTEPTATESSQVQTRGLRERCWNVVSYFSQKLQRKEQPLQLAPPNEEKKNMRIVKVKN